MRTNRLRPRLSAVTLTLVLSACGGPPGAGLVEETLAARIDKGSTDRLKLVEFEKVNGQEAELFGVAMYSMDFTGVAEFQDEAYYSASSGIMGDASITTRPGTERPKTCAESIAACVSAPPKHANRGDRLLLEGTASFEQTENGWQLSNLKFASEHVLRR